MELRTLQPVVKVTSHCMSPFSKRRLGMRRRVGGHDNDTIVDAVEAGFLQPPHAQGRNLQTAFVVEKFLVPGILSARMLHAVTNDSCLSAEQYCTADGSDCH